MPRAAEIARGTALLPPLPALLPSLRAVILAGRTARSAGPIAAAVRPVLALLHMPHPSPTILCTSPEIGRRIAACLAQAAAIHHGAEREVEAARPQLSSTRTLERLKSTSRGAPNVGTR